MRTRVAIRLVVAIEGVEKGSGREHVCLRHVGVGQGGEGWGAVEGLDELRLACLKDGIERHLDEATLCLGAENGVALARACDTQSRKQTVPTVVAWRAQYALDHGDDAGALEQVLLPRILLEDACEGEALYSTLAVVVRRRLNGDVRGMAALAFLDAEEARMAGVGRSQAQEDVEEGTRGARRRLHSE